MMISPKTKQILFTIGIAGSGLFSIVLLFGFIAAQITMIRFLSPNNSPSSAVSSGVSSPQTSQKETQNNPLWGPTTQKTVRLPENQDSRDPAAPVDGSDTPSVTGRSQSPPFSTLNADPRNLGPGAPDSSSQSSLVSQEAQTPGPVRPRTPRNKYTPPAPSWNKPHVPYKRYRKGEQPPWARPTKQVVELRKNDPNFDLTEELSRIRQEMIDSQENAQ